MKKLIKSIITTQGVSLENGYIVIEHTEVDLDEIKFTFSIYASKTDYLANNDYLERHTFSFVTPVQVKNTVVNSCSNYLKTLTRYENASDDEEE